MKKQVLLLFAALVFSQAAFAYDFSVLAPSGQWLFYNILSGSTSVEIVPPSPTSYWNNCTKPIGNIVIPDSVTYNGITYQVTSIGIRAFENCSGLTSVTIPNTINSIGIAAFYGCSGLTSVTIPNSITSIGEWTFENCSGLTSVTIPNSVTSIGVRAFYNCSGLTSVTIPNSVTNIGEGAFFNCNGLTSVTIPTSVTSIADYTFSGCSGLTSVTIGNSVTSIGQAAFENCSGLTSVTFNAAGCTSAGSTADNRAFGNCPNITSFTFGNNVSVIPPYLCYGLSGLTSVTIPNSVTSIGNDAFYNCNELTVHYNGTLGQWCGISFGNSGSNPARYLYINNAEVTSASIPNTITQIKPYTFYRCWGLTSITIPNSVTSIGNYAFFGCSGLTSVTIPNSVTRIWNSAFFGCSGLASVTIPNSVTSIGDAAFGDCSGLTSVTIPNSVTSIGDGAFSFCNGLTSVTIGSSVTSIGGNAFRHCSRLTSMTFLGSIPPQQIGYEAFWGIPTNIPVYIPCGRLAYYVSQMPYFTNYIEQLYEFSAASADESRGTVQVLTEPSCTSPNAVLNAVPANGYHFDHWSTGSTDNPYILTVTSDTTIIGYFVANGTQGIGEVGEDDIHISVSNGHINVEGVVDEEVRVYDITGRMVQNRSLLSGVYIVKIGILPAQKVVVMR